MFDLEMRRQEGSAGEPGGSRKLDCEDGEDVT